MPDGRSALAPLLLGAFFAFATLMCALAGTSLLVPNGLFAAMWSFKADEYRTLLGFGPAAGVGFLLLGAVMAAASIGCFQRRRWGWSLAVVLIAANAAGDAFRAATGELAEGLIGLVLAGLVLWALSRPGVRAFFAN